MSHQEHLICTQSSTYVRNHIWTMAIHSMKWPTAITLVIVLKRSLKEGNGSTKYRAVKNGGQGGPSLSKTFAVTWPSNTTCPPPPPYFQNPLSHIFRPSYGPDVLTTDRRNTESYYDPPRSEQSEPNSITHTIVSSRIWIFPRTKGFLLRKFLMLVNDAFSGIFWQKPGLENQSPVHVFNVQF